MATNKLQPSHKHNWRVYFRSVFHNRIYRQYTCLVRWPWTSAIVKICTQIELREFANVCLPLHFILALDHIVQWKDPCGNWGFLRACLIDNEQRIVCRWCSLQVCHVWCVSRLCAVSWDIITGCIIKHPCNLAWDFSESTIPVCVMDSELQLQWCPVWPSSRQSRKSLSSPRYEHSPLLGGDVAWVVHVQYTPRQAACWVSEYKNGLMYDVSEAMY